MNQIQLSNRILPEVLDCDFLLAPAPFVHMDRVANFHVLIYVTEGVIYVTEEKTSYEIRPGEVFFLKAGLHHFGQQEIPKGTKWYYVHFTTAPLPQEFPPKELLLLPKKVLLPAGNTLESLLADFIKISHSPSPQNLFLQNAKFLELCAEIGFFSEKVSKKPTLPDRIAGYLEEHATKPFSAKELERHFYLSYKYMAACFKKEKQFTMQQYHTKLRMETAGKLLKTTELSIGEISLLVGYQDMLYFSRCFHKVMGLSPSAYRNRLPKIY